MRRWLGWHLYHRWHVWFVDRFRVYCVCSVSAFVSDAGIPDVYVIPNSDCSAHDRVRFVRALFSSRRRACDRFVYEELRAKGEQL